MQRLTLDEYYLKMLTLVASRATCPRREVGAILVDKRGRILSAGYNGVPSGYSHCTEYPCEGALDPSGDSSNCYAIHAEQNAMLQCHRLDLARTLYLSVVPCFTCAKMLMNTNVDRVVAVEDYRDQRGVDLLRDEGVEVTIVGTD